MQVAMQHAHRLALVEMREFVASRASSVRSGFTGAVRKEIYGFVERSPAGA